MYLLTTPPPNTSYWTDLSVAASSLNVPVETVPTLDTSTILASLPTATPDANSTSSGAASFFGLSIRAYVGSIPIAGGITISGSGTKKVLMRVKGPSMSGISEVLSDPKIVITKQNSVGTFEDYLTVDSFGDHADTATNYSDRATGNSLEPVAVVSLVPGTYGVRVTGSSSGAVGNANVEFYGILGDSTSARFFGLSLRGYVGSMPISGGITISGTGTKKVLIRVKGPSMSGISGVLADPKIVVTKQNSTGTFEDYLTVDSFGDHADTAASYSDRATGNSLEPVAVVSLVPGTYGVKVTGSASGAVGNANVEFYEVD